MVFGLQVDASLEAFVTQMVELAALPLRAEGCA